MNTERYERQSFLGQNAQNRFAAAIVGVVGLGGGGSHVVQQLSHIGFERLVLFDDDRVSESNLNRVVGAVFKDARDQVPKINVSRRIIKGLHPGARLLAFPTKWEQNAKALRQCHIIVSCVDSFSARRDLESEARRNLIPLIDVGIDVYPEKDGPPRLVGQIILSMPGHPCMQCLGFLSESNLAKEAQAYGSAGPRSQVIWPNGIVASTAVDIVVDLLTDWTQSIRGPIYLSYDGNRRTLASNNRLLVAPASCEHYPLSSVGAPVFRSL